MAKSSIKEILKNILKKIHLYNFAYKIWCIYKKNFVKETPKKKNFYKSFNSFENRIEQFRIPSSRKRIIFYGYNISVRKILLYDISQKLMDKNPDYEALIISNVGSESKGTVPEGIAKRVPTDVLFFPGAATSVAYAKTLTLELTAEMKDLIDQKQYLREAIQNAKSVFKDAKENYVEVMICYCYYSYLLILEKLNANVVVIWNEFKYIHHLFAEMCREAGVKVIFAEFGSLPGTIIFDTDGQMGGSYPATHFEEFNKLLVNSNDLDKAKTIISSLKESGLNRNRQPEHSENMELKNKLKPGRPIVLFAGQCDRDSGMIPYTETTRKFHSPVFKSSHEAMLFLADLAEKNDWNYIYKPHPLVKNDVNIAELPSNVIFISDININDIIDMSDVVVTILSSLVYVSLIRDTATVMLGYNQIKGKNCAYEAYKEEIIEKTIKEALEKGYTQDQKDAFIKHVAQMEKYYLYNDGQAKEMEFGQPIENAIEFFEELLENTEDVSSESKESDKKDCKFLFVCDSLSELISALQVKENVLKGYEATLLLTSEKLICYKADLENSFDNVLILNNNKSENTLITVDSDSIKTDAIRNAIDEEQFNKAFTDIYLPSLSKINKLIFFELCKSNVTPYIHLFDIYNNSLKSYKNVYKMIYSAKSVNQEESNNRIKDAISELLIYNIKEFNRSSYKGIRAILSPLGQYIWPETKKTIDTIINSADSNCSMVLLRDTINLTNYMEDLIGVSKLIESIDIKN